MSKPSFTGTVSLLTAEDIELLSYIYKRRLKLFVLSYLVLVPMAFLCSLRLDHTDRYGHRNIWTKRQNGDGLIDRRGMILINLTALEGPLLAIGYYIYRKRIACYRRDIKNGVKENVPYTIVDKRAFELTGQYYISFSDPNYMHHEVDADVFQQLNIGDVVTVYRAPKSQYTFNPKGRFTIM